jgi:HEAT repeat protein
MASRPRKKTRIEAKLDEIARADTSPENVAIVSRSLEDTNPLVVARAADAARELELGQLIPQLEQAFLRFMALDPQNDKGCTAKIALVRALDGLDANTPDVFEAAIHYEQIEFVWDERVDVAASLRAIAAGGIGRMRHPEAMNLLVHLLVDGEKIARMGAAQGLGCTGMHEAIGVLRLKALVGDKEAEVVGECFASLLSLDKERSIPFVARFLDSAEEEIKEAAALALGQSRHPFSAGVGRERQATRCNRCARSDRDLSKRRGLLGKSREISGACN